MKNLSYSRRRFLGNAAAVAAAFAIIPVDSLAIPKKNKKPNSKVAGVQLGLWKDASQS
ncbi:MAG: twin-arginine translocation signal domain-containing protein [Bacteroidales bacterium]|nr:twin-arginine translocation signal domain-containing protein [Bacteroidales bacterium]